MKTQNMTVYIVYLHCLGSHQIERAFARISGVIHTYVNLITEMGLASPVIEWWAKACTSQMEMNISEPHQ